MGGGDTVIQSAPQPNYASSMRESLEAQIDLAPKLFQAEASGEFGRPAYAQLSTDVLRDTLLGQGKFVPTGTEVTTQPGTGGASSYGAAGYADQLALQQGIRDLTDQTRWGTSNSRQNWRDYVGTDAWSQKKGDTSLLYDPKALDPSGRSGLSLEDQLGMLRTGQSSGPGATIQGLQTLGQLGYLNKPVSQITKGDYNTALSSFIADSGINPNAEIPGSNASWYSDPSSVFNRVSAAQQGRGVNMSFGGGIAPQQTVTTTGEMRRGGGLLELIGGKEAGFRDGEFQGLSTFGSDIAAEAATRQRQADVADVSGLSGEVNQALRSADPLAFGLLDTMGASAREGLAAGRGLSPRQRREAEQAARMGWESRGLIRDPEAVVSEVESVMDAAGREEAKRRAFAQQIMGASQAMTADPFMAILGRPSGASQQIAQSGLGAASYGLEAGPGAIFDPSGGLNYMMNQQTNAANLQAAQAAASATKKAGMFSGLGALGGGIATGLLMG